MMTQEMRRRRIKEDITGRGRGGGEEKRKAARCYTTRYEETHKNEGLKLNRTNANCTEVDEEDRKEGEKYMKRD